MSMHRYEKHPMEDLDSMTLILSFNVTKGQIS